MARRPKKIEGAPGSELANLLKEAGERPVVFETNGERYRLDRMEKEPEEIWAGYEPANVRDTIDKYAGFWADRDADAMIAELYRARDEGSRPLTGRNALSARRGLGDRCSRR